MHNYCPKQIESSTQLQTTLQPVSAHATESPNSTTHKRTHLVPLERYTSAPSQSTIRVRIVPSSPDHKRTILRNKIGKRSHLTHIIGTNFALLKFLRRSEALRAQEGIPATEDMSDAIHQQSSQDYASQFEQCQKLLHTMVTRMGIAHKLGSTRISLHSALETTQKSPSVHNYEMACNHVRNAIETMQKIKRARLVIPTQAPRSNNVDTRPSSQENTPPHADAIEPTTAPVSPLANAGKSTWSDEQVQETSLPFSQAFLAGIAMEPAPMDETCDGTLPWECMETFGDLEPGCTRGQSPLGNSFLL